VPADHAVALDQLPQRRRRTGEMVPGWRFCPPGRGDLRVPSGRPRIWPNAVAVLPSCWRRIGPARRMIITSPATPPAAREQPGLSLAERGVRRLSTGAAGGPAHEAPVIGLTSRSSSSRDIGGECRWSTGAAGSRPLRGSRATFTAASREWPRFLSSMLPNETRSGTGRGGQLRVGLSAAVLATRHKPHLRIVKVNFTSV